MSVYIYTHKYLLFDTKRVNVTVSDFPSEKPIWVLAINAMNKEEHQNTEITKKKAPIFHV